MNYAKYFDIAVPLVKRCLHDNFTIQAKHELRLLRNALKPKLSLLLDITEHKRYLLCYILIIIFNYLL